MKDNPAADSVSTVFKGAQGFFSGTILSRISGMARDIALAFAFGTEGAIALFLMAYRFANLLRRVFGEGALHAAFIPRFEQLRKENPAYAADFFRSIVRALAIVLIFCVLVGSGILLYFELTSETAGTIEIIDLTLLMSPTLVFICLYGIYAAFLQANSHFFLPGMAPAIYNVTWITAIVIIATLALPYPMVGLSIAVVLASLLQWLTMIPPANAILKTLDAANHGIVHRKSSWREVVKMAIPFTLGAVGVAASQINNALDAIFAHVAEAEGPAYLWYAIRLQQLPLSLFGIALSSALLPSLSRAVHRGHFETFNTLLNSGIQTSVLLMTAATAVIFLCGVPIIEIIFAHGKFDRASTMHTYACLKAYGIGLIPMTLVLMFAQAFYSRSDYKTPAATALVCVLINIMMNTIFVFWLHWGAESVALSTSINALFNCSILGYLLVREKVWDFAANLRPTFWLAWLSIVCGAVLLALFFEGWVFASFFTKTLFVACVGTALLFPAWLYYKHKQFS